MSESKRTGPRSLPHCRQREPLNCLDSGLPFGNPVESSTVDAASFPSGPPESDLHFDNHHVRPEPNLQRKLIIVRWLPSCKDNVASLLPNESERRETESILSLHGNQS